jgi:hypothetical protein
MLSETGQERLLSPGNRQVLSDRRRAGHLGKDLSPSPGGQKGKKLKTYLRLDDDRAGIVFPGPFHFLLQKNDAPCGAKATVPSMNHHVRGKTR